MTGQLTWAPRLVDEILNGRYGTLREDRQGILLHYDGSGSDHGSVQWFGDPRCNVSYNLLVLDDGSYVRIAPDSAQAWHAGRCRPSNPSRLHYGDGNSALLGIAIASSGKHDVTPLQMLTVALLCRIYFETYGWHLEDTWRIVGHSSEAWPRGRKTDPEGSDPLNPILSVDDIRQLLPKVSRA